MAEAEATNPAVESFIEENQSLQAMPENAMRILKALQDPNFGMKQLSKLIEQDAAIAAKVIRTVNSAAYSRGNRITQLDRATVYLGINTVKEIVIATTVQTMFKPVSLGKYTMTDLWDHSVGVAVVCRELATRSRAIDPELAFVAGILHDVGLLLMAQSEAGTFTEVVEDAKDRKTPFKVVEKSYFHFDHCELGFRLGGAWNFPPEVAAAIRWHHSTREAPAEFKKLCMHVSIADIMCADAEVGFPLTTGSQRVDTEYLTQAGLTREHTGDVKNRLKMLLRLHQN
jgi:putative nucleotidyltransferase with HDIG domain